MSLPLLLIVHNYRDFSNQHLAGIHLAAELSNGRLSRCELGSTELTLSPSSIRSGAFEADAKTAGYVME